MQTIGSHISIKPSERNKLATLRNCTADRINWMTVLLIGSEHLLNQSGMLACHCEHVVMVLNASKVD